MNGQPTWQSWIETITRALFNFCTALALQVIVLPRFFHATIPLSENLGIGFIFMANSIVGGYLWRRIFNRVRPRQQELSQNTIQPVGYRVRRAVDRLKRI